MRESYLYKARRKLNFRNNIRIVRLSSWDLLLTLSLPEKANISEKVDSKYSRRCFAQRDIAVQ